MEYYCRQCNISPRLQPTRSSSTVNANCRQCNISPRLQQKSRFLERILIVGSAIFHPVYNKWDVSNVKDMIVGSAIFHPVYNVPKRHNKKICIVGSAIFHPVYNTEGNNANLNRIVGSAIFHPVYQLLIFYRHNTTIINIKTFI